MMRGEWRYHLLIKRNGGKAVKWPDIPGGEPTLCAYSSVNASYCTATEGNCNDELENLH